MLEEVRADALVIEAQVAVGVDDDVPAYSRLSGGLVDQHAELAVFAAVAVHVAHIGTRQRGLAEVADLRGADDGCG
ncbi:MAG: hypothetical protein HC882_05600 [Acidobacteria bacterium]|nr:hypothetical protein [Acidobacteriota bacterium]